MANRNSGIRKTLKAFRRRVLDLCRTSARFIVSPSYRALLRSAVLRRLPRLLFRLIPGLDRFLIRFLVRIGFYPAISADEAAAAGKTLREGGRDFTQRTEPSLSAREAFFARDLTQWPASRETLDPRS